MTRTDSTRADLIELRRRTPFTPFAINFENGDRAVVDHPENVAFDPTENGRDRLFIVSNKLVYYSSLSAVTSLAELDTGTSSS